MFAETNGMTSAEHALGAELVRAAETLLAGENADLDAASVAAQRRTVDALLALYWELRDELPPAAGATVISLHGRTRLRPLASDPGA